MRKPHARTLVIIFMCMMGSLVLAVTLAAALWETKFRSCAAATPCPAGPQCYQQVALIIHKY